MKNTLKSILSITLLLCMAFLFACAKEPAKQDETETGFSEKQLARICELAELFSKFGPCDIEEGIQLTKIERLIPCHWADRLEEAELEGYGKVTVEEADAFVDSVLKGIKLTDLVRTKYDPTKDQECFVLNGHYYIKLSGKKLSGKVISAETLEIVDGDTKPVRAVVDVYEGDVFSTRVTMRLRPDGAESYYILACELGDHSI